MGSAEPLLQATNLDLGIGPVEICTDLDIALATGQCWALLGRNGAGKTTLLHTLAGLAPASLRQYPHRRRDRCRHWTAGNAPGWSVCSPRTPTTLSPRRYWRPY